MACGRGPGARHRCLGFARRRPGEPRPVGRVSFLAVLLFFLPPLPLPILGPAAVRAAGASRDSREGLSSTFSLGFDSFSERYSIEEADTLDLSNEFRSSVGLAFRHLWGGAGEEPDGLAASRASQRLPMAPGGGAPAGLFEEVADPVAGGTGRTFAGAAASAFQMKDILTVSDAAVRNRWDVGLELASRRDDRLSLSNEIASRRVDPRGDLNLSSDYIQEVARLFYRARLTDVLVLNLRDRFELTDFSQEDAYEIDYRRNEAGAGLAIEPGLDSSLEFAYTRGDRAVPDSSAIDYREHVLRTTWWQAFWFTAHLEAQGELERRRYQDEVTRPGYYLFIGDGNLAVRATDRLEVRLRELFESTSYDALSQVYYDRVLQQAGIGTALNVTSGLELGVEPRYTLLRAEQGSEEDYDEWSAVLSGDWIRLDRFWLNGSVELGRRDYRLAGTTSSIYSDYDFVRTNLFGTVDLGRRTTWNVYLSHEPERHALDNDDTTTALLSTELTVRF